MLAIINHHTTSIFIKTRDCNNLYASRFFRGFAMVGPHPYAWYRCSNQDCGMPVALPKGISGSRVANLASQTTAIETVAVACPHCNCVCTCTPIGSQAAIPEHVLSRLPHTSYVTLWLRCGHPQCKSLTRLLIPGSRRAPIEDLKAIVADKRVIGVTCQFGHRISKAIAA